MLLTNGNMIDSTIAIKNITRIRKHKIITRLAVIVVMDQNQMVTDRINMKRMILDRWQRQDDLHAVRIVLVVVVVFATTAVVMLSNSNAIWMTITMMLVGASKNDLMNLSFRRYKTR
jgi:hypothetical protein